MKLPQAPQELIERLALEAWREDGNDTPLPVVYNLAVRGYRAVTMGPTPDNDVGYFDDAFFLVSPTTFLPANANTDPSRLGWNSSVGKPYGMLQPGVWWMYPGAHKGRIPAFRQADNETVAARFNIPHEGRFHVKRMWGKNDHRNYLEWGHQQVNLHFGVGPVTRTSSWLCLTVPEGSPWIQAATNELLKHKQLLLPTILIEGPVI